MAEKIIIKVNGQLDNTWEDWFDGMEIRCEGSFTLLIGENRDEAYIHGILNRIRDLNLKLVSVNLYKDTKNV